MPDPSGPPPDFSHTDETGLPGMVDVSDKPATARSATAEVVVRLGAAVFAELQRGGFETRKGSIVQTAVIAGTMAVKETSRAIPLCHPLPVTGCRLTVTPRKNEDALALTCTVKTTGQTGVEMEALHGASVAALTVYDMCKAMSHDIVIDGLRLLEKRGGKSDYDAQAPTP